MSRARRAARPLGAAARLASGRAASGGGAVLCYHDVVGTRDELSDPLDVTIDQVRTHVRVTRRLGFRFVPLAELGARVVRGEAVDGLVAVAFDDALAGVARHALPVLVEQEVPASLMTVATGWGERPAWWPGSGRTMTRSELVEAVGLGFDIAAHTRTHTSLAGLGPARLRDEVAGCRAELEDLTASRLTQFAYPFGHHDPAAREAVADAGFDAAWTFLNGRVCPGDDRYRLPRLTMGSHHGATRLAYHLGRSAGSWPDHQQDRVAGTPEAL
ncbi:polysaccharide deacetylase family protein [Nocardioides sp.]|uniref:polysaccharide deacetylase family protein n=1 Tax=Nocardioides sp. TaxID=35761 RepID=UPI00271A3B34|nr:polysaccharide deacetylase family protein [Nocardioides sp.]MDO9454927.1 polysaccharide deacetylase family protein [Nocardioides sp.]